MSAEFKTTEGFVVVDGVRVHYCRAGAGPALLLLHGLVGSARNWEQNIRQLAQIRTVYAVDLVNMGDSDRVAGLDASLGATADRVAQTLEHLGIAQADIAGHSHGGAVALMLAARHPEKVGRLVLFAPANPYCQESRGLIRFYNSRPGGWFARLIPGMPVLVKRLAHRRMYVDPSRIRERDYEGYIRGLNADSVEHVLQILAEWSEDMVALDERLDEVTGVPTLLIWGDLDPAVGVQSGRLLAQRIGARLLVLPGVGHLPFAERPAESNQAMLEWLTAP